MTSFSLNDLENIIGERASADSGQSYTKSLLDAGLNKISKKLGEEAIELIIAAHAENVEALKGEVADLLYHLLVLLHDKKIKISDVMDVLESRTLQSGLQEKASRPK